MVSRMIPCASTFSDGPLIAVAARVRHATLRPLGHAGSDLLRGVDVGAARRIAEEVHRLYAVFGRSCSLLRLPGRSEESHGDRFVRCQRGTPAGQDADRRAGADCGASVG